MEVLLEQTMDLEEIVDDVAGAVTRNPGGYHVTDLYAEAISVATKKPIVPFDSDLMPGLAAMGRLWEWVIIKSFNMNAQISRILPAVEMHLGDIEANLDGLLIHTEDGSVAVAEAKCKFGNRFIKPWDMAKWMSQVKAYCKMADTRKVIFYVLYIMSGPPKCVPVAYHLEFTELEIHENWAMLQNTKKYMEENR